jgi:cell division septum initiation protein DivIVA
VPEPVPGFGPEDLGSAQLDVVRRGFDQSAVRTLLARVADAWRADRRRADDLATRLAAAEKPAPPAELDEERLFGALGAETARIVQAAHDAARDIVARAERRAAALVTDAEASVVERTRVAEAEAGELRASVRDEVAVIEQKARQECQHMIDEAREARRRILDDLVSRRRALHLQLEQIRAGKDALANVVDSVAYSVVSSIEEIRGRLEGSEAAARLAASEAVPELDAEIDGVLGALEATTVDPGALASGEPSPTPDESPAPPPAAVVANGDRVVAPPPSGDTVSPAGRHGQSVDAVFAKLRDGRADSPETVTETVGVTVTEAVDETGDELTTHLQGAGSEAAVVTSDGAEPDAFGALVRRDQLLGPPTAELGRALKRVLRLEENELRDRARNLPRDREPLLELVGSSTRERLADTVVGALGEARAAGATFVTERTDAPAPADDPAEARMIAEQLADEIVVPLRARIAGSVDGADDEADPSAAIGVAFREWRGAKIEGVAAHFATWAFSMGALAAADALGVPLSWVVDDGEANCPDCDDNELAGPTDPGAQYPTGHTHPPIHPGCRCVLVPISPD